jgi:hypothetical protein
MPTSDTQGPRGEAQPAADNQAWLLVFGAWLVAGVSTLGALFFGEVNGRPLPSFGWEQLAQLVNEELARSR